MVFIKEMSLNRTRDHRCPKGGADIHAMIFWFCEGAVLPCLAVSQFLLEEDCVFTTCIKSN